MSRLSAFAAFVASVAVMSAAAPDLPVLTEEQVKRGASGAALQRYGHKFASAGSRAKSKAKRFARHGRRMRRGR